MDCFGGGRKDEQKLVCHSSSTKGSKWEICPRQMSLEYFEENGDGEGKLIIKTDQEPSIEYSIKGSIDNRKEGRTIV